MNNCKWNIGFLGGKEILCGKPISEKYTYCYGHEMQYRLNQTKKMEYNKDGYASMKDYKESQGLE